MKSPITPLSSQTNITPKNSTTFELYRTALTAFSTSSVRIDLICINERFVKKKMGKSDDSITRRRNKKSLRKQESKSKVSTRVASIIAAKKRRLTGKRRMCQGMCFSLPTVEDPFNDRHGKTEPEKKRKRDTKTSKKVMDKKDAKFKKGSVGENGKHRKEVIKAENLENRNLALVTSFSFMGPEIVINLGKPECKIIKRDGSVNSWKEYSSENKECPSKFLNMCLNSIQNILLGGGDVSKKPLFVDKWGVEFWNCYTNGKDVLESGGADPTMKQIAWMVSTATDTISMKEKEGISFADPFLLYLVPSQDKAHKVRQVCMPLKPFGIHAVSLHSGVSIDHQINGLKSCEPEFLISTPERLLELLSLNAVDISGISLLVIDGLEAPFKGAYLDAIKSIREFISGDLRTVVFCDCMNTKSNSAVQKLLGKDGSTHK